MDQEIWKDIAGYVGVYQVSNLGRCKRVSHHHNVDNTKTLVSWKNNSGYNYFSLSLAGKKSNMSVHGAVANAFYGPPNDGFEINHKDGNKQNNKSDNLEYKTHSENLKHAHNTGLHNNNGETSHFSKISEAKVIRLIAMYNSGIPKKEIYKELSVTRAMLESILKRKSWCRVTKNIPMPTNFRLDRAKGENLGNSKLKDKDVLEIVKLKDLKIPTREIAAKFNVLPEAVNCIYRGATWSHLTKIKL